MIASAPDDKGSIPREVEVPPLSKAEIKQVTKTVFFRSPPLQSAKALFILGSSAGDWGAVADLYRRDLAKLIAANGLTGRRYDETGQPLAHYIRDELVKRGVPMGSIIVQDKSTNTLENVKFGKLMLARYGINPQSIIFISKSHHSGRVFLTLRKFFPKAKIYAHTYDAEYDGTTVSIDDWWKRKTSRERVYGEYIRILKYSERGGIVRARGNK